MANHTMIPNWVIDLMPELRASTVEVLVALCRCMDWHRHTCRISYPRLMEMTGIKNRHTIAAAIAELEDIGAIDYTRGNKGYTNFYRVCFEPPEEGQSSAKKAHPSKVVSKNDTTQCQKMTLPSAKKAHPFNNKNENKNEKETPSETPDGIYAPSERSTGRLEWMENYHLETPSDVS